MKESNFKVGSRVVFAKSKVSPTPGQRATDITPQGKGDEYSYVVEKYWIVSAVNADGTLHLRTRRGKEHTFPSDDPRLRKAKLWERLFLSGRFPALGGSQKLDGEAVPPDSPDNHAE